MKQLTFVNIQGKNVSIHFRGTVSIVTSKGSVFFGDVEHIDSKKIIVKDVQRQENSIIIIKDILNIIIGGSEVTVIC